MVLSIADSFSSCFPTFVAPVADFFFVFLASRDDNDAVLFFRLCFAPPLKSRMDWMLVLLESDGFWSANGAGVWMLADVHVVVEANNMDAKHKLWNFKGLIFSRNDL